MVVFSLSLECQSVINKMKRLKVKDILKMLKKDGWYLKNQKGSHRQFKHEGIKGKVTVNGKSSETLS